MSTGSCQARAAEHKATQDPPPSQRVCANTARTASAIPTSYVSRVRGSHFIIGLFRSFENSRLGRVLLPAGPRVRVGSDKEGDCGTVHDGN